jgi:hypothetical protein
MRAAAIARALHARRSGRGWIARCPGHEDRTPSLSIIERDGKVLIHCFGGCGSAHVIVALRSHGLVREARANDDPLVLIAALRVAALQGRTGGGGAV